MSCGRTAPSSASGSRPTDLKSLPELVLEHGDVMKVPPKPSTIAVVGTVYNENAYIFNTDMRVSEYISQAGGPTKDADTDSLYVVRADGTVISKRQSTYRSEKPARARARARRRHEGSSEAVHDRRRGHRVQRKRVYLQHGHAGLRIHLAGRWSHQGRRHRQPVCRAGGRHRHQQAAVDLPI